MAKKSKKQANKVERTQKKSSAEPSSPNYPLVPGFMSKWLDSKMAGPVIGGIYMIVILMFALPNYQVGPYFDVVTDFYWDYAPSAENFQNGSIKIGEYRGPMYPIALGITGFLISDLFTAGLVLSALSAGLMLFFMFNVLKNVFRADLAFCVVLLTAVNPTFVQYSYSPGTDMFFSALVAGVLYFIFNTKKINIKYLVIAALLTAMAYLTRYNGLFIVGAVPIALVLFDIYREPLKQRLIGSGIFVAAFFLFITPWGLYCLQEKGDFFFNKNYENIAYEVYGKGEMGWDEFWFGQGVDVNSLGEVIFKDPSRFFGNVFANIPGHFFDDMDKLVGYTIGYFTIAGLALLIFMTVTGKHSPTRQQLVFYLYNLLFFAVILLVFHGARFSLFLVPFYITLGMQIFILGSKPAAEWIDNFRWVPILVAVLFFVYFQQARDHNQEQMNTGTEHLIEVQRQFKRNVPEHERTGTVTARQPHIAYMLGLKFRRFPHEQDFNKVMQELREREVEYLFYGIIEYQRWPQMRFLMENPHNPPQGLEPVVILQQTQTQPPVVLYRILY